MTLDPQAKKQALRAINYGLYVLTAKDGDELAAAGVNWLTQASFEPPLIAAAVKSDNDSHRLIEATGVFAVNVLGVSAGVRDGGVTPLLLRDTGMNYGG